LAADDGKRLLVELCLLSDLLADDEGLLLRADDDFLGMNFSSCSLIVTSTEVLTGVTLCQNNTQNF